MQITKQQLDLDMEKRTVSKLGKEYLKTVYCPPYLNYMQRNARLHEAQTRIKIAWRNIKNLKYADDSTLIAESEE